MENVQNQKDININGNININQTNLNNGQEIKEESQHNKNDELCAKKKFKSADAVKDILIIKNDQSCKKQPTLIGNQEVSNIN